MTKHNFHESFLHSVHNCVLVPSEVLLAQQGFLLTGIPFWLVSDFQNSVSRFYPSVRRENTCILTQFNCFKVPLEKLSERTKKTSKSFLDKLTKILLLKLRDVFGYFRVVQTLAMRAYCEVPPTLERHV